VDGFLKLPAPLFTTADELNLDHWIQACADADITKELNDMDDVTIFLPSSVDIPDNYSISAADILRYRLMSGYY
jgi:hypothetical protein